ASRVPGPRSRTARANHRCAVGIGRGRRGPSVEVPAVAAAEGSAHRWTFTQNTRTGAWGPGLCCEGAPPAGAAQSPRPAGRVSKPGVLPRPSEAVADFWQTAHHSLRGGFAETYCTAPRLPGG